MTPFIAHAPILIIFLNMGWFRAWIGYMFSHPGEKLTAHDILHNATHLVCDNQPLYCCITKDCIAKWDYVFFFQNFHQVRVPCLNLEVSSACSRSALSVLGSFDLKLLVRAQLSYLVCTIYSVTQVVN
jgi:hypothetical protein